MEECKMKLSESTKNIFKALSDFKKDFKQPLKDADNPFFKSKYVPLENVVQSIDNEAPKHGLGYFQSTVTGEGGTAGVITVITHSTGEYIEFDPLYLKADKPTAQGMGSAITYARRYSLSSAFGIASDVDDDGNEASGKSNNKSNSYQSPKSNQGKEITEPTQSVDASIKAGYAKIKSLSNEFDTNEKINAWIKDKGKYSDLRQVNKAEILAWLGKLFQQINQKG